MRASWQLLGKGGPWRWPGLATRAVTAVLLLPDRGAAASHHSRPQPVSRRLLSREASTSYRGTSTQNTGAGKALRSSLGCLLGPPVFEPPGKDGAPVPTE